MLLNTDSYKASHFLQYPPGTTKLFAYLESRKGARYSETLFFGLQAIIKKYLTQPIGREEVLEASHFWKEHGEPFDEAGWMHIVNKHGGHLPIRIRAVPEGSVVHVDNVLMTVESTDPAVPWVVSYVETLLMRLWYPTTVATRSMYCKRVIKDWLDITGNDWKAEIGFKLHDFGARGVSSQESAELGGMAHLVNFMSTDTVEAIIAANKYYNNHSDRMYDFSIPAMEHSTVTSWGQGGEVEAYRNMLRNCVGRGHKLIACVSDSYDLFHAVENIWCGELLDEVKASGATVVIRPDSGNAAENNIMIMKIIARKCAGDMKASKRGYAVLPDYFRVIQGDGNDSEADIDQVLFSIVTAGFSASNIAFGMGGGLLQKLDRDTQRFAYKLSAAEVNSEWRDVQKVPKTDPTKASKAGRLELIRTNDGSCRTVREENLGDSPSVLETVYENGWLVREQSFDEIRALADQQF